MPVHKAVFENLVAGLTSEGRLVERNQRLALPEHRSTFRDEDAKLLEAVEALFRQGGFQPPSVEEVAKQTNAPPAKLQKILKILREHDRLVQVEEGMLFHREAVDRACEILREHFRKEERLESVQFKYLLDTTRKFAIPLLDYMDKIGVTRRVGNTRLCEAEVIRDFPQSKTEPAGSSAIVKVVILERPPGIDPAGSPCRRIPTCRGLSADGSPMDNVASCHICSHLHGVADWVSIPFEATETSAKALQCCDFPLQAEGINPSAR